MPDKVSIGTDCMYACVQLGACAHVQLRVLRLCLAACMTGCMHGVGLTRQ
jgi:hypothetical protein